MDADLFVPVLSCAVLILSTLLHLWKGNLKFFGQDVKQFAINDAEFSRFRRTYSIGHLIVLFSDSIQASYTYFIFDWYNTSRQDIAFMYAGGLVANIFASLFVYRWLQKVERRLVCSIHCILACLSYILKNQTDESFYNVSRVVDGITVTLLLAPFQEWYMHEHLHKYGFPTEWVQITFRSISIYSTFLAVVAGYFVGFLHNTLLDPHQVINICVPIPLLSCLWIFCKWSPNRAEPSGSSESLLQELTRSFKIISRRSSILLLCALQALYESSYILFSYVWTPLFLQLGEIVGPLPSIGGVYGCLMTGMLLGTVIYCKLSVHLLAPSLLSVATTLSCTGMFAAVFASFPNEQTLLKYNLSMVMLVIYQLGSGIYFPTIQRLQKDILPADNRSSILFLSRIPLNLLAICTLLILVLFEDYGNWLTVCVSAIFNIACLVISFILARKIKQSNVDYFILELKTEKEGEV